MLTNRLSSPWTFKQGLFILMSFVCLYLAFSAGHILWVKHSIGIDQYLTQQNNFYIKVMVISQCFKALAIFLVIYFVALRYYQVPWQALGFKKTTVQWVFIAIVAATLAFIARLALMKWVAIEIPSWAKFMQPPIKDLSIANLPLFLFLLLTIIITPVVEEMFFRGFLFQWMSSNRPVWIAAIVSSIMFGVSHISPPQVIAASILSLVIILLYVRSGSIWPAITAHVVNNLLSIAGRIFIPIELTI